MGDKLHYDVEQFAADVDTYGLYDYEVFADYVTYEQFVQFNGGYLKIAVEKGAFTFEDILELIERCRKRIFVHRNRGKAAKAWFHARDHRALHRTCTRRFRQWQMNLVYSF